MCTNRVFRITHYALKTDAEGVWKAISNTVGNNCDGSTPPADTACGNLGCPVDAAKFRGIHRLEAKLRRHLRKLDRALASV